MTKEEKKLEKLKKLKQEQEDLKKRRQARIDQGLPAEELEEIQKNLYLHNALYALMKIVNTVSGYKKDFLNGNVFYKKEFLKFLDKLYEEHPEYKNRPIIFAPNHVRMQDIAIEMDAIPLHMVLLSGDFENVHPDISGKLLEKNGILYLDMDNPYDRKDLKKDKAYLDELKEYIEITGSDVLKEEYEKELEKYNKKIAEIINDRKNIKTIINDVLKNGYNMLWYYEASWNFSENMPYYDGYNYIVQAAVDSNAIVLPVAFDLVDKKHIVGRRRACIKFGNPIDYRAKFGDRTLTKEEKVEGLDLLKGEIGKLLFEIWEENSFVKRDDLARKYSKRPTAEDYFVPDYKRPSPLRAYWDEYKKRALKEWKFTEEDIAKKHFVDKTKVEQEDVFKHLDDLNLNQKNAFLLSKRNHH